MAKNSIDELKNNPAIVMQALAKIASEDPEAGAILFARTGRTPQEIFPEATGQSQPTGQGANSMVGINPLNFMPGFGGGGPSAGGGFPLPGGPQLPGSLDPSGGLGSAGGLNINALLQGLGAVQAAQIPGTPAPSLGAGQAPDAATAGGLGPGGLAQILALLQGASGTAPPGVSLGQLIGG